MFSLAILFGSLVGFALGVTVGGFETDEVRESGFATEVYTAGTPADLSLGIETGEIQLIDVRSDEEWNEGHIEQAEHRFLGRMPQNMDTLAKNKRIVVQCLGRTRSAIAASLLQAAGFKSVVEMEGGYAAWKSKGLPSVKSHAAALT